MGKPSAAPASSASSSVNSKDRGGHADGDEAWRVLLLRALVTGDVELAARALHDHIEVLSLPFTKPMPDWKVQWESLYWWMLRDATPLFIASVYSHPALVQWLLLRGADRSSKCYLGRTPIDFVGECCEAAMTRTTPTPLASVLERSEACRKLLTSPPTLPAPPMEGVHFTCHVSSQVVVVKTPPLSSSSTRVQATDLAKSASPVVTQQTIYKCLAEVTWETPLSNGALIEKYEVRHRMLADEGNDASGGGGDGGATNSWRIERAPHNRKVRQQRLMVENLQFDSTYEVMLRSWNAAGKGDWGRAYKFRTLASPDRSTT